MGIWEKNVANYHEHCHVIFIKIKYVYIFNSNK